MIVSQKASPSRGESMTVTFANSPASPATKARAKAPAISGGRRARRGSGWGRGVAMRFLGAYDTAGWPGWEPFTLHVYGGGAAPAASADARCRCPGPYAPGV